MKGRKRRPVGTGAKKAVEPTAERRRHARVERAGAPVEDANGGFGLPHRVPNAVELMLRANTITKQMYLAAELFHRQFWLSGLDPVLASDLSRVPVAGNGAHYEAPGAGIEQARARVVEALNALGGLQRIKGNCAWMVLGREMSLTEWKNQRGFTGQSVNFASGVLFAVLEDLENHYAVRGGMRRRLTGKI